MWRGTPAYRCTRHWANYSQAIAPTASYSPHPTRCTWSMVSSAYAQVCPRWSRSRLPHTLAEGARLCEAAERANVKLLVGHHRRHSPILHKAVEIVSRSSRAAGRCNGQRVFYKPDSYFDEAPWRRQPGGGPILLNMIHEVANLRAMVGEIVAVQAFASNARRGFQVEDTVAISLRFANGALGAFLLSDTAACARSWEQTAQENRSYATYPDEDCYVIIGASGSLAVPTMRIRYYARRRSGPGGSRSTPASSNSSAQIRWRARSSISPRSCAVRQRRSSARATGCKTCASRRPSPRRPGPAES